jgi:hypothetical protein
VNNYIIDNKMESADILLIAKIVLFAFIISSPFYNVAEVFSFMDNAFMKITILIFIVGCSFIDLQLAIVLAVAFFILVMSMNATYVKKAVYTNNVPSDNRMLPSSSDIVSSAAPLDGPNEGPNEGPNDGFVADEMTATSSPYVHVEQAFEPMTHVPMPEQEYSDQSSPMVMQNMYEFPDARCVAPRTENDASMNDKVITYFLDDKIKPYEEFIAQLTSKELLDSVSNGAYIDQ